MRCGLGSALLKEPEKIADIVHAARNTVPRWRDLNKESVTRLTDTNDTEVLSNCPFSVSAKIRIPSASTRSVGEGNSCDPIKLTVELVRRLAVMGVDWVTLHARTTHQRNRDPASWNVVQELVDCKIKHSSAGCISCSKMTGCHGVMVGRSLLKTPYLFAPKYLQNENSFCQLMENWLHLSAQYTGGTSFAIVHQQAYWMLEQHLDKTKRLFLHNVGCFQGLVDWLTEQRKTVEITPI
ncbi:unnamed protein product [Heterobilharzia americana]|nr:unnamed protein product [Heterobilharzia americana]